MKIIVVVVFSLLFSFLSVAQSKNNPVQDAIQNFADGNGLEYAGISFMAYNLDKDSVVAIYNPKMMMPAASTTKLFTTAAALDVLGKNYRSPTKIYYSGEIDSAGVLHGNIVIRGFGDPSLGSRFFYEEENRNDFLQSWALSIADKKIKRIEGRVIADASAFGYHGVPDGWTWSDMGNYYGAPVSACSVFDDMTYLHFSSSNSSHSWTKIDSMTPPIPGYEIFNRVESSSSSSDQAYIYGAPYSFQRFAIGHIPRSQSDFRVKVSIPDPELLMAQVVEKALKKDSISVNLPAIGWRTLRKMEVHSLDYNSMHLITTYLGKPLQQIIWWTNMRSVNHYAEQLLRITSYEQTGEGNYNASISFINNYWENRLGIQMHQTDGCGLARSNGFSAYHFIQLFKYLYASDIYTDFIASLPVAGESGTLTRVCRGEAAQGRLKAKSGTLSRVKAYAGFVDSQNGDTLCFALIVNNDDLSNYRLIERMEEVFNAMAR